MAVRTERKGDIDVPLIARVTAADPRRDDINVIWMEGNYSGQWKAAKAM